MPKLFNAENCLFQTMAVASMASNATQTGTFTGVTANDYCFVLNNTSIGATSVDGVQPAISAADTIMFTPIGAKGGSTSVAQTVGVVVMVAPTTGVRGGSW
jgi:hypothetical protein